MASATAGAIGVYRAVQTSGKPHCWNGAELCVWLRVQTVMRRTLAVSVVVLLLALTAMPTPAETRGRPFTAQELLDQSTLVFEGVVTRIETVQKYAKSFPVAATVARVLKGTSDAKELSFRFKSPGIHVIFDSEFNLPAVGDEGTFYLQEQDRTLVLIGYITQTAATQPATQPTTRTTSQ